MTSSILHHPSSPSEGPWFFSDPSAAARIIASCESCRGTPFRFGSRAKGITGGMDCTAFLETTQFEGGAVPKFNFPRRPRDMSRHVFSDKFLTYMRGQVADDPQSALLASIFAELDVKRLALGVRRSLSVFGDLSRKKKEGDSAPSSILDPPSSIALLPGDIHILKTGKGLFHLLCLMRRTAFMQCAFPDGVTEGDITAPNYRDHLVAAFRARALPHTSQVTGHTSLSSPPV